MNSTVFEMIIRVFGAFLSIYSFAVLLQVPRRFVLQAGIVGAIGGFVYLLAIHFGRGDLMASLYSAVVISFTIGCSGERTINVAPYKVSGLVV